MSKSATLVKPSIEQKAYDQFCRKFKEGAYGSQRFGQAFYNEFSLHKINDQSALKNIHAKDGDHARNSIKEIFHFT